MRGLLIAALIALALPAAAQDAAGLLAVMGEEAIPWAPSDEDGLFVWMCASDDYVWKDEAGTTPSESGDIVRRWDARDANADYATGDNQFRVPAYTTDATAGSVVSVGSPATATAKLNFVSTNINAFASGQSKVGVYAVWKDGDPTGGSSIHTLMFHSKGDSAAVARIALFPRLSGAYQVQYRADDGDAGRQVSHGAIVADQWYISSIVLDYSNQIVTSYLDGGDVQSNSTVSASSDTDNSLMTQMFLSGTTSNPMPDGSALAELILVRGDHDRQKFEGWMAWDRGLEGSLPSDHPYKNAPPTQ